jgi:3-deoxy-D-arabino-heptulosonate 7-phosphate (DAHP) synthase
MTSMTGGCLCGGVRYEVSGPCSLGSVAAAIASARAEAAMLRGGAFRPRVSA